MFTRLLLKLAGPVPCLKTRAIDTRRRIILRRIHRPSKIQRATQTQKPCYSITQCIRAAFANIFVANISVPPFWKRFAKFFGRVNFATYGTQDHCMSLFCLRAMIDAHIYRCGTRVITYHSMEPFNCMLEYDDIIQAHCYGFKSSKVIIDN